jgi:hypothetical protein
MPWVGNQYIFPRAAPAYATWPVTPPAPPAPPTPPAIPQRWRRPGPIDDGGGYMDPTDPGLGPAPSAPGPTAPGQAPPAPLSGFTGRAPGMSLLGTGAGLGLGIPGLGLGLGLLGAVSDVSRAEEALAEEYGAHPPGYGRVGYDPDLSTWGAFLNAISPFGILGESVAEQMADEISHMSVAGLEGIGYGGFGVPGVAEREAAEAWGGFETAPPDAPFADFGFGFGDGGYGGGGYGGPGASDIGGEGMDGDMGGSDVGGEGAW